MTLRAPGSETEAAGRPFGATHPGEKKLGGAAGLRNWLEELATHCRCTQSSRPYRGCSYEPADPRPQLSPALMSAAAPSRVVPALRQPEDRAGRCGAGTILSTLEASGSAHTVPAARSATAARGSRPASLPRPLARPRPLSSRGRVASWEV